MIAVDARVSMIRYYFLATLMPMAASCGLYFGQHGRAPFEEDDVGRRSAATGMRMLLLFGRLDYLCNTLLQDDAVIRDY